MGNDPGIDEYLNAIGRIPLLSADDELRLGREIAEGRDAGERLRTGVADARERQRLRDQQAAGDRARAEMIRANLRLVVSLVRRYGGHQAPLLDLVQEGNIGLMRAVERFDYRFGYRFSTYATWWIRQAVSRAAPEHRVIRVPQQSYEQLLRCRRAREAIAERCGRPGTDEEVAEAVGLSADRVRELMRLTLPPVALDAGDETTEPIAESEQEPWHAAHENDVRRRLSGIVGSLSPRARTLIRMRYGFDGSPSTYGEIAQRLGISAHAVRRLERETLASIASSREVRALDSA